MSDAVNFVYDTIDESNKHESAMTRRKMVAGAAGVLGSFGLLNAAPAMAENLGGKDYKGPNTPENILNVAATAEVLATIVNTVGPEKVTGLDAVTKLNVQAAAREELIHYEFLTGAGAKPLTTKIWVPDAVFSSPEALLKTLVVGDQIFCNAYLLGVTVFSRAGGVANSKLARYSAEIMGVEAVHRALALQSLGKLGNDRAYTKFSQREEAKGIPSTGSDGFFDIRDAAKQLQAAGFGFGVEGAKPGAFYEYADVAKRTPNPAGVNTLTPR